MIELIPDIGKEVLSVGLLLPIIWYFIKTNQRNVDSNLEIQKKGFKDITDALILHMDDDKKQFEKIVKAVQDMEMSIGKNVPLTTEMIIDLASKFVWAAGTMKIDFIKARLEKNNLQKRKDRIKAQIRAELIRISGEQYITPLNHYNTKVGLLGSWISNNFPMDEFLEEVFEVIFCEDTDIDRKIADIYTVMKGYQNDLWSQLRILLNN